MTGLRYAALLGLASGALTYVPTCADRMEMVTGMNWKTHGVSSAMDIKDCSITNPGDECTVTKCRYGELSPNEVYTNKGWLIGQTKLKCTNKVIDSQTVPVLEVIKPKGKPWLDCQPIRVDPHATKKMDRIRTDLKNSQLHDIIYHMMIFKLKPEHWVNGEPTCKPGRTANDNQILWPEREFSAKGRFIPDMMMRFWSSHRTHWPNKSDDYNTYTKLLQDDADAEGKVAITYTGWSNNPTSMDVIRLHAEEYAVRKTRWSLCKKAKSENNDEYSTWQKANEGKTRTPKCVALGKLYGKKYDADTDLDNYAVMVSTFKDPSVFNVQQNAICKGTRSTYEGDYAWLLETPVPQVFGDLLPYQLYKGWEEENVGGLVLWFVLFVCFVVVPALIFALTMCCRCCCFMFIRGKNKCKPCCSLWDKHTGLCTLNSFD